MNFLRIPIPIGSPPKCPIPLPIPISISVFSHLAAINLRKNVLNLIEDISTAIKNQFAQILRVVR